MYALLDPARARTVARRGSSTRTRRPPPTATLTIARAGPRRQPPRRHDPGADARAHAAVRDAARDARGAADRQRLDAPRPASRRAAVPRSAPGRAAAPHGSAAAARRRCWPATARRSPQGPSRTSPIPDVAGQIVGTLGPIPADEAADVRGAQGYPPDATGRARRARAGVPAAARGTPGGHAAGRLPRCWRSTPPEPGHDVQDDDQPDDRAGGDRRDGRATTPGSRRWTRAPARLLALAGVAFSALQPPGSTMKIITATAALEAGIVTLGDRVPDPDLGDDRRLHAPERQRRGVRRHVPQRVRRLVQLGVRAARGQARRRSGWWRWPSGSASTSRPRSPAPP